MDDSTLYEKVMQQVRDEIEAHENNVCAFDVWDRINEMTNVELLQHISRALEVK
jgi:hypothetical protein